MKPFLRMALAGAACFLSLPAAHAQLVVNDTLTGATSSYPWKAQGGACLTAGSNAAGSTLPSCSGLAAYSGKTQVGGISGRLPDAVGSGALRLTNGDTTTGSNGNNVTGSVVSTTPFPTSQGVQVTFSTVTYGGNAYTNSSNVKSGADGIAFFLMDGTKPPSTGAFGGSLGYSCANTKGDSSTPDASNGVDGGYLGVGIDEFGNFSNPGDSTADGPGQRPGTIVVRGAGSITYASLNALNPTYYPNTYLVGSGDNTTKASARLAAVQATCKSGKLVNWSGGQITDKNNKTIANKAATTESVLDYPLLASVPVTNPIFNQEATANPLRGSANVLTYNLKITQNGLLSLTYSSNGGTPLAVISNQSITSGNGPLPSSFLFGFTAGTGGGSNVHEITCFKAAPISTSADAAASSVPQSGFLQAGTQIYLASYHPLNYWGQLTASNFLVDASGNLSIQNTPNWDASCVLTGGACASTGANVTAEAPSARRILTINGSGADFTQLSNLSVTQQSAIGGSTDGAARIAYLRGDRTNEIGGTGSGAFRHRDGVLGDIRNSSPTWVGAPAWPYSVAGSDLLTKVAIPEYGSSYVSFTNQYKTRPHVVYVGANDGMVHGFRAGALDNSGNYVSTNNDGKEVLAYIPDAVVNAIHPSNSAYDFSSPVYTHNAYVDASPDMDDLYYNGAWHTWLIGGLGAGVSPTGEITDSTSTAKGVVYALDITDSANFATASASSLVIGEWSSSTIVCVNDVACGNKFGSMYGTPLVRRLHDGNWAIIFGNGRNSATGAAGIFIASVDRTTGVITARYLDTGTSSTTVKNGIDFVSSGDLDSDHVTDYLYAGDSAGHIWRFDITSSNPNDWIASSARSLLFTTPAGQPISTAVAVARVVQPNSLPRLMIGFGTGRQTPQSAVAAAGYATGTQYLYGIWDWNLAAWNAKGSTQYAVPSTTPGTITSSNLVTPVATDKTTSSGVNYRTGSTVIVCWFGSTTCSGSSNTQLGWAMALPDTGEQVIYNPSFSFNTFVVNTTIPSVNQALSCVTQPASGYTMAVSIGNGSSQGNFASASTNLGITDTNVVGLGLNGTGGASFVSTGSGSTTKTYLITQTGGGTGLPTLFDRKPLSGGRRLTWVKLK